MKTHIINALLVIAWVTAGCQKMDETSATKTQSPANTELKIDLKGVYPGLSKTEIESTTGTQLTCESGENLIANALELSRKAELALKEHAELIAAGKAPVLTREQVEMAQRSVKHQESNTFAVDADLIRNRIIDTICFSAADFTFANKPATIEIYLKDDKVRELRIGFTGKSDDVVQGFAQKYNWIDSSQPLGTEMMKIYLTLDQGIDDTRGNKLFFKSDHTTSSFILMDQAMFIERSNVFLNIQKQKLGVKDM